MLVTKILKALKGSLDPSSSILTPDISRQLTKNLATGDPPGIAQSDKSVA